MILGQPVPTLSLELLFLVLSAHGTKHQWQKLSWLVDLNELMLAHPELDFGRVYGCPRPSTWQLNSDLTIMLCRRAFPMPE